MEAGTLGRRGGAGRRATKKEAPGQGGLSCRGPAPTYQQAFDGELLQAPVPRRVEDDRQRLVRGLDVANLYLVLHRASGSEARVQAAWVLTPSVGVGGTKPPTLSPACGQGQIHVGGWTPGGRRKQSLLANMLCNPGVSFTPRPGDCPGPGPGDPW